MYCSVAIRQQNSKTFLHKVFWQHEVRDREGEKKIETIEYIPNDAMRENDEKGNNFSFKAILFVLGLLD